MTPSDKLHEFFWREFDAEERTDFSRLSRVLDSHVAMRLNYFRALDEKGKQAFRECCLDSAYCCYAFVVGAPPTDNKQHPFFEQWLRGAYDFANATRNVSPRPPSVPLLRGTVQQYKMDAYRGIPSRISKEEFEFASAVRSVKAPELRKRVRAALKPLGYYEINKMKRYCCRLEQQEFQVDVDYGGMSAQLRYCVSKPEFAGRHPLRQFRFETAFGFGHGNWDYIVEQNVDEVFALFAEVVRYSVELPNRIRAAVAE